MAKHKKTLKEKKRTDLRQLANPSYLYTLPSFSSIAQMKNPAKISHSFTHSLQEDLLKTLWVSGAIVILQLALFFVLHNHYLILPWKLQ